MLASALMIGCGGATTEPLHSDVDRAREAWLTEGATSYTFELATASSWFPKGGYVLVQVNEGLVVAAVAPVGDRHPPVCRRRSARSGIASSTRGRAAS